MENLLFEKKERVGILTINRPQALNALNRAVLEEMDAFLAGTLPGEEVRVLILTGTGEKAFVAGADIREMQDLDHMGMLAFCDLGQRVCRRLEVMDVVTIAAVNGFALGGGLELALGCDFIYASKNAKLGLPEVSLGLIPGFGGGPRLARAVGGRRAKEMILTGKPIRAEEAAAIGLVNKVVEPEELLDECLKVAKQILKNGFTAITQVKRSINYGAGMSLPDALELEKQACSVSFATADRAEGMAAFAEKRKPDFK